MWKSKFYGAFVLNHRVVLHAIDATPARWRGDAGSSPLDRARTAASSPTHPTHWLISTQAKSAAQKAIISEQQEELQNFRDSVVGMRAVVKAAAPGGGGGGGGRAGPPAAPARWYWEESPARLAYHPVVKPPHWIPYEDAASARLEKAFVARQGKIQLTAAYEADVQRMLQTNLRTGFSRNMLRDAPPVVPVARPAAPRGRRRRRRPRARRP